MQRDAKAPVLELECVSESPGRLGKTVLAPTRPPRVSGSVGLELWYPNFSLGDRSKFEFRSPVLAAVKTHASYS